MKVPFFFFFIDQSMKIINVVECLNIIFRAYFNVQHIIYTTRIDKRNLARRSFVLVWSSYSVRSLLFVFFFLFSFFFCFFFIPPPRDLENRARPDFSVRE